MAGKGRASSSWGGCRPAATISSTISIKSPKARSSCVSEGRTGLAALIIVFREIFEAGIVVGKVMAVTRTVAGRGWWVASGVVSGVLGASMVAVFAGALSAAFDGAGQELFNAAVLGLAAAMLVWHNVWMASHGRELATHVRAAGEAVAAGSRPLIGLTLRVAGAGVRGGGEVGLFLYCIAPAPRRSQPPLRA